MIVDTHCHLYFEELNKDLDGVLSRANELGVNIFICVGTNINDSHESLTLAQKYKNIYATAGIHPHDSKDAAEDDLQELRKLLDNEKIVAVGEMGLDYFRNISNSDTQKIVFKDQLKLAEETNKPIVFHNREADEDIINILSDFPNVIGVAHCFSSSYETAIKLIEMGFYISFSGNLTFKNSHLPEVAKKLPLDRLLVETDSPFLSPVPFRGKTNEPGRTRYVVEKLAEIFDSDIDQIASITTANAKNLFNLV
jgi:TatD DNase family protein